MALLGSITALDEAQALSGVLDVLTDRAARHARRVLLLVHRDQVLTGWRWHGYTPDPKDAAMLEIPLDDEGLVARAARSGSVAKGSGPAEGQDVHGSHAANGAVAVPLAIDRHLVAVLYAEAPSGDPETIARVPWAAAVEVLARHAARCLESMTARRLPELVRAAAAALETATGPPVATHGVSK